jgi:hypothetical protein
LDFIGKYENLNDDFDYVCEIIGLKDAVLPKLVVGSGQRYTEFYDPKMVDIVYEKYKEEIRYFGFEFGE